MFGLYSRFKRLISGGIVDNPHYGEIFPPVYNPGAKIDVDIPEIFNSDGEKMDVFFLRDIHTAHHPYKYGSIPTKFLWDRYNIGLKTHFYSHNAMLETMGKPERRYGTLIETRSIVPEDYEIFKKHPGLKQDFDSIFTYDSQILNCIDNARFVPWAAKPWFGTVQGGGIVSPEAYTKKKKNISFMCSKKIMCDLHRFRFDLAHELKKTGKVDTFGTFDGGPYVPFIADVLSDYRYSICIENEVQEYYFSERLTSCFLSMTVPVYLGASKIGDFFNTDGIIQVSTKTDFNELLKSISEEDYLSRLPAILDNYQRVQKYLNIDDYMYNEYLIKDKKC